MTTTLPAWRFLATLSVSAAIGAGCAVSPGMDDVGTSSGETATSALQSPASERVIPGIAEMVLTNQAWPTFEQARENPITMLVDGSPLFAYIRAARPLGELAHPADPGGSYSFSEYPHLFLQVGDTDGLRILGTCYVTLTGEEARMREIVVPLAPLTYRPGQIPADCWLATAVAGGPGKHTYEVRLAGFAGKFESWLPVADLLAVVPLPTDLAGGAAEYATMLRATPLGNATLLASTTPVTTAAVSPGSALGPAVAVGPDSGAGRLSAVDPQTPRTAAAIERVEPIPAAAKSPAPVAAAPDPVPVAAAPDPVPVAPAPDPVPVVAAADPVPVAAAPDPAPVAAQASVPAPTAPAAPVVTRVPSPAPVVATAPSPGPVVAAAPSPEPVVATVPGDAPVVEAVQSPAPIVEAVQSPAPIVEAVPSPAPVVAASTPASPPASTPAAISPLAAINPTAWSPSAVSAPNVATPARNPALVAINSAPLPGPRQEIGSSRLELQLQTLSTLMLGRQPSEAYFMDRQWTSTTDQRGRVVQQHAYAAAIFKGASCSWLLLKAFRRPGAPGLLDVEAAGEPIEISCTELR